MRAQLVWSQADEQGIVDFLVKGKGFNEDRVRKAVQKLNKLKSGSTQGRLDTFFKPIAKAPGAGLGDKRKLTDAGKKPAVAAKKKPSGGKPRR